MGEISKSVIKTNVGDGPVGINELLYGIIDPVVGNCFYEGLFGRLFIIFAKSIWGHADQCRGFIQQDLVLIVVYNIAKHGIDPFRSGAGSLGTQALLIQQCIVF